MHYLYTINIVILYAKNASDHDLSAKKYYDFMNEQLEEIHANNEIEILDNKAYEKVCMKQGMSSTEEVAYSLQLPNSRTEQILYKLWKVKGLIKPHVPYRRGDYKTYRWIKNCK